MTRDRVTLRGVGLLSPGTWNNRPEPIPIARIDLLMAAHDARVRRQVIDVQYRHGGPVVGFAYDVRMSGDELVADLTINTDAADLIDHGLVCGVSVETQGVSVDTKLRAVSLQPRHEGVAYFAQRPLRDFLRPKEGTMTSMMTYAAIRNYSLRAEGGHLQDDGEPVHRFSAMPWRGIAEQLAELANAYADQHGVDMQEALTRVMADPRNNALVVAYASRVRKGDTMTETEHPPKRPHDPARMVSASEKLHQQATAYAKARAPSPPTRRTVRLSSIGSESPRWSASSPRSCR
jgi:hypothetical protein